MTKKKPRPLSDLLGGALLGGLAGGGLSLGMGTLGGGQGGQKSPGALTPEQRQLAGEVAAARGRLSAVNPGLDKGKFDEAVTDARGGRDTSALASSLKADQADKVDRWQGSGLAGVALSDVPRHAEDLARDAYHNPLTTLGGGAALAGGAKLLNDQVSSRLAFKQLQRTPGVYGVTSDLNRQGASLHRPSLVAAARQKSPDLGRSFGPKARRAGYLGLLAAPLLYRQFMPRAWGGGGYARTGDVDAALEAARRAGQGGSNP